MHATVSAMSGLAGDIGAFAQATAVSAVDSVVDSAAGSAGAGRYGAEIHPGWDIGGNANGGYLMAIAGRAMATEIGRPPLTLTAHYLRPGQAGPCEIDVHVVRSGRRLATARATMSVDGKPILELLGTFGDQQPDDGPSYVRDEPVDIVAYDDCAPMSTGAEPAPQATDQAGGELSGELSGEASGPPLMDRLACRLHPADVGFRAGRPTGDPTIRGWFALADEEPIDAIGLLLAADAFPPPIFNSDIPMAWVPTVELTVHIRAMPTPGPLRVAFRNRFIHDGLLDEEGELWDSAGTLVAQCRQLALMPRL